MRPGFKTDATYSVGPQIRESADRSRRRSARGSCTRLQSRVLRVLRSQEHRAEGSDGRSACVEVLSYLSNVVCNAMAVYTK